MTRKGIGIIAAVLVVIAAAVGIAGGYFGLWTPRMTQAAQSSPQGSQAHYETAEVKKGSFTDTIQTTGSVRSSQTAVLPWQTSGTVKSVSASKGQSLAAGAALADLETSTMPQAIIMAQADLVNAQKALDTLLTSSQARANAGLALVKAQQALDDATKARRNMAYQRASPETIDIAHANLISANDALDKAEKIFDRNRDRSETDVVYAAALAQYAKARQNQIKAQYNYDYVRDLPDPLDVQEADAKVDVAQANLLQAKTDWERVKDGPNEQDVAAAQARVDAARAAINLGHITAPFAGTVTQAISKAGDQVTPGTAAFQVDDLSHLYVDMAVAEVDIARVKIGQKAALTLDALPGKIYSGSVTDIASVGKSTASTVNFTVTVELNQPGQEIKPGMTVAATIAVGQAQDALYVPSTAVRSRSGQDLIYLIKNGAPAPAVVLTGDTVDGSYTLILNGAIKEGDLVITNLASTPASQSASLPTPIPLPDKPQVAQVSDAVTPTTVPTPQPTAAPTAGADTSAAVKTVQDYFAALQSGDYQAAAGYLSTFSLSVDGMTRGDGADELHRRMTGGTAWSALQVKDSHVFNETTTLVHVTYTLTTADAKSGQSVQTSQDELWPVRYENGQWRVNRNNLIDLRTLSIPDQMMAGLRVKPLQLSRYSDRLTLTMMVQNTTNEAIVFGQPNEILAAFSFNGQQVEVDKQQLIFDRLRSYSAVTLAAKGLFASYPDGVIIRQWKNIKVAPWFDFRFSE